MINFKEVNFIYESGERTSGIYNINLTIQKGEVVVFCGESGCGKTTVTRLINGLIPAYYKGELQGSVEVNGHQLSEDSINTLSASVGSVFQNPRTQFFNVDSTSEIAFACENFAVPQDEICSRIGKVTQVLDIKELLDTNLFSMSGGEKQKIACASAAVMEPDTYVLDEPSSNLDIKSISSLKKIIEQWKSTGSTIVIAEHRLHYLIDIADKFVYMKNGKIEKIILADEFKNLSLNELNRMGLRSIDSISFKHMLNQKINNESTVKIKNFALSYTKKQFLDIPHIEYPKNAIIGVLGVNGSGKSTFSKCLCGIEKKARGSLFVNGNEYSTKKRLDKCFMVMQDVNHQLFTESVKEEIGLSIDGDDENKETLIYDLCKNLNLMDVIDYHPMSLSGGQKQRVAIASAIASNREVLIFDEPTSGLDFKHMKAVALELIKLSKMGKTIFVISHDPELLDSCCNYYMFLDNGKVNWYGAIDEKKLAIIQNFFEY